MKAYIITLSIALIVSAFTASAQVEGGNEDVYDMQQRTNTTLAAFLFTMDEGATSVQGEPFLYEEWLDGTLFFVDDTVALKMRYHVLNDQLVFIHPHFRKEYVAKPDQVNGFRWTYRKREQSFIRWETWFPELDKTGYAEVLRRGRFWILREHRKRIAKADHKDPFGSSRNFDKIIDQPTQLLVLDTTNSELIRWNGSRSDWKKLVGKALRKRVQEYAERHKLDTKALQDLPALLKFVEESR